MAAIYSNGGNRWNILGFNFTKRDALSSLYKISMVSTQFTFHRAWNNVPKVPDHGDRQSWLSLLFSGWKPCFPADHKQFLADHWSAVISSSALLIMYHAIGIEWYKDNYDLGGKAIVWFNSNLFGSMYIQTCKKANIYIVKRRHF